MLIILLLKGNLFFNYLNKYYSKNYQICSVDFSSYDTVKIRQRGEGL